MMHPEAAPPVSRVLGADGAPDTPGVVQGAKNTVDTNPCPQGA